MESIPEDPFLERMGNLYLMLKKSGKVNGTFESFLNKVIDEAKKATSCWAWMKNRTKGERL